MSQPGVLGQGAGALSLHEGPPGPISTATTRLLDPELLANLSGNGLQLITYPNIGKKIARIRIRKRSSNRTDRSYPKQKQTASQRDCFGQWECTRHRRNTPHMYVRVCQPPEEKDRAREHQNVYGPEKKSARVSGYMTCPGGRLIK
jgi:hypothetical protein